MNRFVLVLCTLMLSVFGFAQEESEVEKYIPLRDEIEEEQRGEPEQVYMIVENMPRWESCNEKSGNEARECTEFNTMMYIQENSHYPDSAMANGIFGTVFVGFVVNKKGNVQDVAVLREVDPLLDAEAVRVVSSLPKFIPGKQRGKAVNVRYVFPVKFSIHN